MKTSFTITFACALFALTLTTPARASSNIGNTKYKAVRLKAPDVSEFAIEDQAIKDQGAADVDSIKRKPAGGSRTNGSEDLMTSELKAFRDRLVRTRTGEQLDALLRDYDTRYDSLPNDLKYVIARLSPLIPFRGFFWRMATLAHQAVVSQELLLISVRAWAEQAMLMEPDTQWQGYMTFFSIPNAELLRTPDSKGDGVKRPDMRFYVENDLSDFLATEVYQRLATAVKRLAQLPTSVETGGRKHPLVFDNRIRFGENAFNQAYDSVDRFKIIGDAERYAAMARFHRRMAAISQLAAYNLNGNIALRREIGRKYGIDATLSGMSDEPLSIDGLTREERVRVARGHAGLFQLRNREWMKTAYFHLTKWSEYLARTWESLRTESDDTEMLLDPELFTGKKDQTDKAIVNLRRLFPGPKASGVATVQGAVSGDEIQVDMRSFFLNPPSDLKLLMPTGFSHHEDIEALKTVYGKDSLKLSNKSTVTMKLDVDGRKKSLEFRNYLFGRATGWDPTVYASLYPGVKTPADVARAQRIINETRGARPLMNTLLVFVK